MPGRRAPGKSALLLRRSVCATGQAVCPQVSPSSAVAGSTVFKSRLRHREIAGPPAWMAEPIQAGSLVTTGVQRRRSSQTRLIVLAAGIARETVRRAARSMFERFTDRARRVVVLAGEEARMLNHGYIGTEHILLGMLREGDGVAAQVLVRLGADLNRVRQQVIQLVHGYQGQDVESAGPRPGGQAPAGLPGDALARFDALDRRLTVLERWVSMQPDLDDLDQEIAQVRRDKQAAAARQDSGAATALRDKEKQLIADRADREKAWAGSAAGRRTVARELTG
jgi:hypothetical protein